MATRPVLLLSGLVALLVGAGLWVVFAGDAATPAIPPDDPEAPTGEPATAQLDPLRQRELQHRAPWPHQPFEEVIAELKAPEPASDQRTDDDIRNENWIKLQSKPLTIRADAIRPAELIALLQEELKDTGVRVYTYPEAGLPEDPMEIYLTEQPVNKVLDVVKGKYPGVIKEYMTVDGLCLGTQGAIEQAQLDVLARKARERSRRDRDAAVLDAEYRADYSEPWHVSRIAKDITAQTGVEVVVDAQTWGDTKAVVWRVARPLKLRDALDRICEKLGCYYRVKDERVYLLAP